jgi:5-methylthioadenosine/S-adenosylhomocysteine deaminase
MRKIIRDAQVLTFDDQDREFSRANILIDPPNIVALGPEAEFPPGTAEVQEIDGAGLLAIPGLINGHFHSPANLMKGMVRGLPLEIFMLHEVPPLSDRPPPARLVYIRTLLGALEMLKLGVTSVQDDAFFVPFPDQESIDALMQAYGDSGLRATAALDQPNVVEYDKYPYLSELLPEAVRRDMEAAPIQSTSELRDLYGHLIDTWHGSHDGRLRAAVSCSAPHRVTQDYFAMLSELSRSHEIPFYVHILETKLQRVFGDLTYGKSLVRYVHDLGFLDERMNVIHGIWLDDQDLDLIAQAGSVIAHNPVCNLRLGSGIMPFRKIRDFGIPVCLGSDEILADDTANMWAVAKMAGLIHNIADPDYRIWPLAEEVLQCLFQGGARAMGLEDQVGAIAPDRAADIVLLDLNSLAFTPLNDLRRQLVYCETGSSVRMTMVAGQVVVQDGRVLSVDEEAIKAEARDLAREHGPELARAAVAAQELEPYYREMYLKAAATDVGMNRWGPSAPDR